MLEEEEEKEVGVAVTKKGNGATDPCTADNSMWSLSAAGKIR